MESTVAFEEICPSGGNDAEDYEPGGRMYQANDRPPDSVATASNLAEACDDRNLKAKLLLDAAQKEPHIFYQYDGFLNSQPDCVFKPDEDGDALFASVTPELRHGGIDVRIQILAGTPKKDAVRILKKMAKWMKRAGDWAEFEEQAAHFANGPKDNSPF